MNIAESCAKLLSMEIIDEKQDENITKSENDSFRIDRRNKYESDFWHRHVKFFNFLFYSSYGICVLAGIAFAIIFEKNLATFIIFYMVFVFICQFSVGFFYHLATFDPYEIDPLGY